MTDPKSECNNELFIVYLQRLLNWVDVPSLLGITTNENKEPLDKQASYRNTTWFIALPESNKYYLPPTNYLIPHEIPACYQGRQAILESDKSKAKAGRKHFNFPMSTAEDKPTSIIPCSPSTVTNIVQEHKKNACRPH